MGYQVVAVVTVWRMYQVLNCPVWAVKVLTVEVARDQGGNSVRGYGFVNAVTIVMSLEELTAVGG